MTTPLPVPTISTEPVASVLRILSLKENGEDSFIARSLPQVRRVYGGQVLAQGLLAASATVPEGRLPHSLHAYFVRGGDPESPFTLDVTRVLDGRSFTNRSVSCFQDTREILTMSVSFQGHEAAPSYSPSAPQVPSADECRSAFEIFRLMDHPVGKFLGKTAAFDVRHIGQSLYTKADPLREPAQRLWMKPRAKVPESASQYVHRALLTYVVDQVMLEPALRTLGLSWMSPGLVAASLDHAMWFHHDVDINEWFLFDQRCTQLVGGRVLVECSIFSAHGTLLAHATQEAMLRIPSEGHTSSHWGFGVDPKTGKPMSGMA